MKRAGYVLLFLVVSPLTVMLWLKERQYRRWKKAVLKKEHQHTVMA